MKIAFQKATKKQAKARIALFGASGSGKTWNALELAQGLGERVAVVDTEHGSASKYSDRFSFDVVELQSFEPQNYIDAIRVAEGAGYDVLIIDSLSHAWVGKGGLLDQNDRKGGRFDNWKDLTPQHMALIEAILTSKLHIIATMRSKTEYVVELNAKGKNEPRKVGLAPVQRDGLEYEFDVVGALDEFNAIRFEKTRCSEINGKVFRHENAKLSAILKAWLSDGATPAAAPPKVQITGSHDPSAKLTPAEVTKVREALSKVIPGAPTDDAVRAKMGAYIEWCACRKVPRLSDLTKLEGSLIIQRADAGEMPPQEEAA